MILKLKKKNLNMYKNIKVKHNKSFVLLTCIIHLMSIKINFTFVLDKFVFFR